MKCRAACFMIKAIIFDMDGVITDSELVNCNIILDTLKPYGVSFDYDYYSQFPGGTSKNCYEILARDFSLDFDPDEMVKQYDEMRIIAAKEGRMIKIPGAVDAVKYLAGKYTLALASGSAPFIIERVLTDFGIKSCFSYTVSGETIPRCKPAPDIFLNAAAALGILPEECAVIEDSTNGVMAAKAAGMYCIGFVNPNSGRQDLSSADRIIMNMNEICEML